MVFRMSARCGGGDAFGDGQQPRPVDPGTDQLEGTTEVIEINGNGHVSAGRPAPSDIVSHEEPVDASVRRQVHQVLMMGRDKPQEPSVALTLHSPSCFREVRPGAAFIKPIAGFERPFPAYPVLGRPVVAWQMHSSCTRHSKRSSVYPSPMMLASSARARAFASQEPAERGDDGAGPTGGY